MTEMWQTNKFYSQCICMVKKINCHLGVERVKMKI